MRAAVTLPANGQSVEDGLDLDQLGISEHRGVRVLNDALDAGRTGDGDGTLGDHPADGDLRRRHALALALGDALDGLDQLEVLVEDRRLEAR